EKEINSMLVQLPNLPHSSVNKGKSAEDNIVVHEEISSKFKIQSSKLTLEHETLNDKTLPHWELGVKYGILDFERGVKITGSGFPVYKGKGAKLQRALINLF